MGTTKLSPILLSLAFTSLVTNTEAQSDDALNSGIDCSFVDDEDCSGSGWISHYSQELLLIYNCLGIIACRSGDQPTTEQEEETEEYKTNSQCASSGKFQDHHELLEIIYHIARNACDRVSDCSRHHRLTLRAARAGSLRHRRLCGEELEEKEKHYEDHLCPW